MDGARDKCDFKSLDEYLSLSDANKPADVPKACVYTILVMLLFGGQNENGCHEI